MLHTPLETAHCHIDHLVILDEPDARSELHELVARRMLDHVEFPNGVEGPADQLQWVISPKPGESPKSDDVTKRIKIWRSLCLNFRLKDIGPSPVGKLTNKGTAYF